MRKTKILWALAWINILLLVVLLVRVGDSRAYAQVRRPSDYLMLPATLQGNANGVVYVIDTSTGALSGLMYDDARRVMVPMPPIDLNRVFSARPR